MRYCVRALAICAVLLLTPSCKEQADADVTLRQELRHANGLTVRRPDGFSVTEETDGFAFKEDGMIRYPRVLRVLRLEKAPSHTPTGSRKLRSGATASYRTGRRGGGMGGDDHTLIAWRAVDGAWIMVSASVQAEFGVPGFPVAWVLIDQARIAGPKD